MIRREFIKVALGSLSPWPYALAAIAQQSLPTIGALAFGIRPAPFDSSIYGGFLLGMHEQGIEGKDYSIEWRFADGNYERLAELARELVGLKVDVIFATSVPAILAAQGATTSIPIVMGYFEDDPIKRGLATSLGHPAGNVTGLAVMQIESLSKHFDLIRAVVPKLNRLGILTNPRTYRTNLVHVQALAEKRGTTILNWEADNLQGIETAFNAMTQGNNVDAVLLIGDSFFFVNRGRIADLSLNQRLPLVVAGVREFTSAGALMSYGANVADSFRRSAAYVGKILKGAKAADLPIEEPTQFDLAINLKTARALGLSVPLELMVSATEVVE